MCRGVGVGEGLLGVTRVESTLALLLLSHTNSLHSLCRGIFLRFVRDMDEAAETLTSISCAVAEQPYKGEKDLVDVYATGRYRHRS